MNKYNGLTFKERCFNTIATIEYSNAYNNGKNLKLFNAAISILSKKIKTHINLDQKEIHIFLMPFPSVEKFREYYLKTIK